MATRGRAAGGVAAAAVGAGAVAGAIVLSGAAVRDLLRDLAAAGWEGLAFDTLLTGLAALVLATGAAWLGLATVLTVLDLLTGLGHTAAARVTPGFVRRLVAVTCGAALGGTALGGTALGGTALGSPALGGPSAGPGRAADAPAAARPAQTAGHPAVGRPAVGLPAAGPHLLRGLPLPDRPVEPRALGPRAVTSRAVLPATSPAATVHVVRPGESLWSVTAEALGPQARARDVVAGWRRLYVANRDRVGHDPDLLLPGTILRLPPPWTAGRLHQPPPHGEDPS